MTCQQLVELVTDYLEGRLGRVDRARFERHIDGCDGCTTYLAQYEQTIRLTGELREEQIDPDARRELLAAFRDWSHG